MADAFNDLRVRLRQDMAQRKKAEAALKASHDRFQVVMDSLDAVVYVVDMQSYEVLFLNQYGREGWGDVVGRTCWQALQSGQSAPCTFCTNEKLVNENGEATGIHTWEIQNTVDHQWYECRDQAIRWTDGRLVRMEIATNITERKQAIVEREQLITELEAKNAELERFTYTVSHDLKSPLVTITGFLGFLEQDAAKGDLERLRGDIQRIREATNTMQQLLNELLELSRIGRLINPPQKVVFEDLVQEALARVAESLAECQIRVTVAPHLPRVYGDRSRLVEVIQNLVENAVKFLGDQPAPRIDIGAKQQGDEVVLYVADNGIGIAPQYQEKIFGLFERLDPSVEGTGVGLALVKRIIEVHDGRIWVESEVGKGATFYFTLPLGSRR